MILAVWIDLSKLPNHFFDLNRSYNRVYEPDMSPKTHSQKSNFVDNPQKRELQTPTVNNIVNNRKLFRVMLEESQNNNADFKKNLS